MEELAPLRIRKRVAAQTKGKGSFYDMQGQHITYAYHFGQVLLRPRNHCQTRSRSLRTGLGDCTLPMVTPSPSSSSIPLLPKLPAPLAGARNRLPSSRKMSSPLSSYALASSTSRT